MTERTATILFSGAFAVIMVLSICMMGSSNGWTPGSILAGIVWGFLCLPGLMLFAAYLETRSYERQRKREAGQFGWWTRLLIRLGRRCPTCGGKIWHWGTYFKFCEDCDRRL